MAIDQGASASAGSAAASQGENDAFRAIKNGPLSVFDSQLASLYLTQTVPAGAAGAFTASVQPLSGAISGDGRFVTIDATAADGDGAALLAQLEAAGLQYGGSFGALASGLMPVASIGSLLAVTDLKFVSESGSLSSAGLVTNQGAHAVGADAARATYGVDGTGVTVGILSDSFNNKGGMATDIASGDLPANTQILQDLSSGGTDEGRGMAQLVHDVAPGSPIIFATAFTGMANFANNIIALYNAGARVIADDVTYFAETAYQDGVIAQAIDQVTAQGAVYFSSAANDDHKGFEAAFASSGITGPYGETLAQLRTGSSAQFLPVTIPHNVTVFLVLQWNQPAASVSPTRACQSDVDLFLYDQAGTSVVTQSVNNNIGNDPVEIIQYKNIGTTATFNLAVGLYSGAVPTDLKLMALDNGAGVTLGTSSLNTSDGTIYGHAAAAGAIAVGAAYYARTPAYGVDPPVVESYSSGGPTRILFDTAGNALATPDVRQTPQITAPDGGDTTFFGFDSDGDGWPNFFGTSAAAPDAADVAALMLQANPALDHTDILHLLEDSARDMDNPATAGFDTGFDNGTGYGLIQADRAVRYAVSGIITADAGHSGPLFGTHLADSFVGTTGNDTFDGGLGLDTVVYSADRSSYSVTHAGGAITVSGPDGTDTLAGIERLQFADTILPLSGAHQFDFNGDGKADILFTSTNSDLVWIMNDRALQAQGGGDLYDPGFGLQVTGDFDGNGKSDVLFENPTTGGAYEWQLDGTVVAAQGPVDVGDPAYRILGTADFNGDGRSDVLWRSSAGFLYEWQMNGMADAGAAVGALAPSWHVVGAGDFNGDGTADLLLRNISGTAENGAFYLWEMNGTSIVGEGGIERPGTDWVTLGTGDFDGNGKADFAVRNSSNGAVWVYLMDGTAIKSQGAAGIADSAIWHVQEIADLNGDGKDDILFRNDAGTFYNWDMNGSAIASEGPLQGAAQSADPSLHVVGQHWDLV